MTPKEMALELYSKYYNRIEHTLCEEYSPHEIDVVKQCALIAVDEILNLNFNIKCDASERCVNPVMDYWQEVKQEIELL